jgi:hypothetical protein
MPVVTISAAAIVTFLSKGYSVAKEIPGELDSRRQTSAVVRRALCWSLCRYDPDAPGVEQLAERIEERMWQLAANPPPRERGAKRVWGVVQGSVRRMRRQPKEESLDFPHWREQLEEWVRTAAQGVALEGAKCQGFPTDARTVGERFPGLFFLELSSLDRMTLWRKDLVARLAAADELGSKIARGLGRHQGALVTGTLTVLAGWAGYGAAEIGDWSQAGLAAGLGAVVGAGYGWLATRNDQDMSADQRKVCMKTREWVCVYLGLRAGVPARRHPLLLLQAAIERESARRHSATAASKALEARQDLALAEALPVLEERLQFDLIPEAEVVGEPGLASALRELRDALAGEGAEGVVLPAIHTVLVALEVELPAPSPPEPLPESEAEPQHPRRADPDRLLSYAATPRAGSKHSGQRPRRL